MDRELLLGALILLVCGPLVLAFANFPGARRRPNLDGAVRLERRHWLLLWLPCLPAALVAAMLLGWALQEPHRSDETIRPGALLVIVPLALLWLRALLRAAWSWFRTDRGSAAFTVGMIRPRIVVDPSFGRGLDPEVLQAVLEHEAAHARHRDPLRIWLAQLGTDLQWPTRAAGERLRSWLSALELARDEEARTMGADGSALAAGILAAVGPRAGKSDQPAARIEGVVEPRLLRERIERLLAPALIPTARLHRPIWIAVLLAVAGAMALGFGYGDEVVRWLPGVRL